MTDQPSPTSVSQGDDAAGRRLAIGGLLSVLTHAAVALVLMGVPPTPAGADEPTRVNRVDPAAPPPPKVDLGIERSTATTMNWVGFEEYQRHAGLKSEVDQAALARAPGLPGDPSVPQPAVPPSPAAAEQQALAESQPEPEPQPEPAELAEAPPESVAEAPEEPATSSPAPAEVPAPAVVEVPEPDAVGGPVVIDQSLPEPTDPSPPAAPARTPIQDAAEATPPSQQPAEASPAAQPESQPQSQPNPRPAPPTEAETEPDAEPVEPKPAGGGGAEAPAEPSEKESDAAAIEAAVDVVLGRPLAAEGLEIVTRRPRFATTTLLTANPKSPVVLVTFGRDGTVIAARFAVDGDTVLDSGNVDVDQPLLDAIYTWRAKGVALDELPVDDEAGVTISIRIAWTGL